MTFDLRSGLLVAVMATLWGCGPQRQVTVAPAVSPTRTRSKLATAAATQKVHRVRLFDARGRKVAANTPLRLRCRRPRKALAVRQRCQKVRQGLKAGPAESARLVILPKRFACGGALERRRVDAGGGFERPGGDCVLWLGDRWLPLPAARRSTTDLRLPPLLRLQGRWRSGATAGVMMLDSRVDTLHPWRWPDGASLAFEGAQLRDHGRGGFEPRSGAVGIWGDSGFALAQGALRQLDGKQSLEAFMGARESVRGLLRRRLARAPSSTKSSTVERRLRRELLAFYRARQAKAGGSARRSLDRAGRLGRRLPKGNSLRTDVELEVLSTTVDAYWRQVAFGKVRRLSKTAFIAWERRQGDRALALKQRLAPFTRGNHALVEAQAALDQATLYLAYARTVELGLGHAPLPPKIHRAERIGVTLYQELSLAKKLTLLQKEAKRLLRRPRREIAELGDKALTKAFIRLEKALETYARITARERSVVIDSVVTLPGLPVALRGKPRGVEHLQAPLRSATGLKPLSMRLGKRRTLLYLGDCRASRGALAKLARLAVDYHRIGLRVAAVALGRCERRDGERGYWRAGALLSWALQAEPHSLVVLDGAGALLGKRRLANPEGAAQEATSWLSSAWPAFARARRRGALPPPKALAQRLKRLEAVVHRHIAARRYGKALILARRVSKLAPERSEAQRLAAMAAGYARDVDELVARSTWWRQRYGDLAAEALLDELRKLTKLSTFGDLGRGR